MNRRPQDDPWDTDWIPTTAQMSCKQCRRIIEYPGRPLDWVPWLDFGHTKQGHAATTVAFRLRLTSAAQLAAMTDDELRASPQIGRSRLAVLRRVVAETTWT